MCLPEGRQGIRRVSLLFPGGWLMEKNITYYS